MDQRAEILFGAPLDCLQPLESVRALDCVLCSKIFVRARNNAVTLKNNTERAERFFIALSKVSRVDSRIN